MVMQDFIQSDDITMLVNGKRYGGWKNVSIRFSLNEAARSFAFEVTEAWNVAKELREIRIGYECKIFIGADQIIEGWVEQYQPSFTATSHTVSIAGRSKSCDIVDCSAIHDGGDFHDQTLEQILRKLIAPYNLDIQMEVDEPDIIRPFFQLQQGETTYEAIERLCRLRGCMVSTDTGKAIRVFAPGGRRSETALFQRSGSEQTNILSGSAPLDYAERFSHLIIKGQQLGSEEVKGADASEVEAAVRDDSVTRYRPLLSIAEGNTDPKRARKRAEFEIRRRAGKSLNADITIAGWRQNNGELWDINLMAWLESDILGIARELLIIEVEFTYGEQGKITKLKLSPLEAWQIDPETIKNEAFNIQDRNPIRIDRDPTKTTNTEIISGDYPNNDDWQAPILEFS